MIQIEGTEAVWVENQNFPNNYTLQKSELKMGKSWLHDKTITKTYGWTEEEIVGKNAGKISAYIPTLPDEDDPEKEVEHLGYFSSVEEAMQQIIETNHPSFGIHF